MTLYCGRCGAENPDIARHCGDCGALLEEAPEAPAPAPADPASAEPVPRCVRCNAAVFGARRCLTCGEEQPLAEDAPDPWVRWMLLDFPALLRSPVLLARQLPYRHHLGGILLPLLAMGISLPLAWLIAILPLFHPWWSVAGRAVPDAGGLAGWLMSLLILAPVCFLGYAALLHGLLHWLGGAGTLERTLRVLALLYAPGVLLVAGWFGWLRLSQLLLGAIRPAPGAIGEAPALALYYTFPILCLYGALLTALILLIYQTILLAAIHRLPLARVLLLHLVLAVLVSGILLTQRRQPVQPLIFGATRAQGVPRCMT